jgi:hypothetical protein
MHRQDLVCLFVFGFFAISALMAESVFAQNQAIRVVAGTYGGNCNAPHGNKTEHLAVACNGRADCTYKVDYTVIGDPAVGCGKDYVAEWWCGGSLELHRVVANPEAGFGSTLTLQCEQPVASATDIQVVAGTYGGNCNAPHGNKTEHLAAACNGRVDCTYKVDYTVIGDPAVGCRKDYVAEWRCGGSREVRRTVASPEAGFGKTVELSCSQ